MILILHSNTDKKSKEFKETWNYLNDLPDSQLKKHIVIGKHQKLTEIYLVDNTSKIDRKLLKALPAVERVMKYPKIIGLLVDTNPTARSLDLTIMGFILLRIT